MNREFESLVAAWMKRGNLPAPALVLQDDGRYATIGIHDAAIIEAVRRLGYESIRGFYLFRCNDEQQLLQLAAVNDAIKEEMLNSGLTY